MQEPTISSTKTNQNCINSFHEKLNNNYFRREFNKTKIPRKYKSLGLKEKNREISLKTYNHIISKYFDIFYNELYHFNKPSYFFLGGFIEKKRTKSGVRNTGKRGDLSTNRYVENPISLSWTDLFFLNQRQRQITYKKTKGSTSKTAAIEKEWNDKNSFLDLKKV